MTATEFTDNLTKLRPTLQALTMRFTYDSEVARDLVQDTLLRALTYRDKFRNNTNLKGWLFTIMRNTYINQYRKTQRERMARDKSSDLRYLNVKDEHTLYRPQENMEFEEIWKNVNDVADDLLIPFKMHLTGYKYEEIASQLQIPLGTVKNRIFHARKEIQKKLQGYR